MADWGAGVAVDFATSSAVFHDSVTGVLSLAATSISTSAVARVEYSGFITGPATVVTASIDPDSGALSTHDSRNEWSGRMRSACALVSSMKLPTLAMNG